MKQQYSGEFTTPIKAIYCDDKHQKKSCEIVGMAERKGFFYLVLKNGPVRYAKLENIFIDK